MLRSQCNTLPINYSQQWAREPDLRVKSFTNSILSTSRSICLPFQGVLLDRTSNPHEGFVFRAEFCSRNHSSGKHCSHCASKTNVLFRKIIQSVEPIVIVQCDGKQATAFSISRNPDMATREIRAIREEIRRLR